MFITVEISAVQLVGAAHLIHVCIVEGVRLTPYMEGGGGLGRTAPPFQELNMLSKCAYLRGVQLISYTGWLSKALKELLMVELDQAMRLFQSELKIQ